MTLVSKEELQSVDKKMRAEIATKVGSIICNDKRADEHEAALSLAKLLVEDVSVSVRQALSNQLRKSTFLPSDIIEKLVNDIDQVSNPFLISSAAIDDKFLIDILHKCNGSMQEAIASRHEISERLTYVICDVAAVDAVSTLMANEGASLTEESAARVTERFPLETSLLEVMVKRSDLPVEVVKLLIFKVSRQFSEYLAIKFSLATDYSEYLMSLAERDVFHKALEQSPDFEIYNYFTQLHESGGLTSDLLFSYIQGGYSKVFMMALAALSAKTPEYIRDALNKDSTNAIGTLLNKCGYSRPVVGAIVVAFERQNPKRA